VTVDPFVRDRAEGAALEADEREKRGVFWAIKRFLLAFKNALPTGISDTEGETGCSCFNEAGRFFLAMAGCCDSRNRMSQDTRQDVCLFARQNVAARVEATEKTASRQPSCSPMLSIGL